VVDSKVLRKPNSFYIFWCELAKEPVSSEDSINLEKHDLAARVWALERSTRVYILALSPAGCVTLRKLTFLCFDFIIRKNKKM